MIIAFANQKGGVGKTTSVHNVATALAQQGKKVLMVDLDPQATLTIFCGLEPADFEEKNITSVLATKKPKPAAECIYKISDEVELYLMPAFVDLATAEQELISRAAREKALDRALEPIKKFFDFIIIDCPPQLSILSINGLSCADGVIVPVKTDYAAYRGLTLLNESIKDIQELINPNLVTIGTLATIYEKAVNDDNDILQELQNNHNVLAVISKTVQARKGNYEGKSVVEIAPSSDIAQAYMQVANYLMNY